MTNAYVYIYCLYVFHDVFHNHIYVYLCKKVQKMEDQFFIQNNVKVNQYQQKNSDITRTIFGIHWSNVHCT